MTSSARGFARGLAAGAVGTTVLNAVTQLDMAVRGRPASRAPEEVAAALTDRLGVRLPGGRRARGRRLAGLGPLGGTAAGVVVGGLGGVLRSAGLWLPAPVGGALLGAAAMLATDGPIAALGVDDPRRWSAATWATDVVPHLAYGLATHAALIAAIPEREAATRRPPPAVLLRAAALGAATGSRSSAGMTGLALASSGRRGAVAGALAGTELLLDKSPVVPPRTGAPGLAPRIALGAASAATLAHREGCDPVLPGAIGLSAALASSVLGQWGRSVAARRFGSDLPGAIAEDVLTATLAWVGARRAPERHAPERSAPAVDTSTGALT
ncbi:hypothetical protein [Pseudonocardia broussonetiae]|uniref:hypothetical protein n=1 Tax=Pseudonocardia broussonetiae TaxID=2736640 RepID=UPI00196668C2|nr:hypothetical protein [Pseudonocardia broussonetiae]